MLSAKALGVLAVVGLVVAFSLSSTLVKRAETPGVLVAFWRMITVSILWNAVLWSTGRRVTLRDVRQVATPGLGVALGPVAGGILLERFWWGRSSSSTSRCGVLALGVGRTLVPESRDPARGASAG